MARAGRPFAWVSAASLFIAAVWYALISQHISVDDPPGLAEATVEGYYDWFASTVTQERSTVRSPSSASRA